MEYAARLPRISSRRTMLAPVVALVLGAVAATGAYALIDNSSDAGTQASKVIVVESPAPGTADIAGKNESATAAAISQSSGLELRGSKASASGQSSNDADTAARTDPHGPAASLRNP